MGEHCASAGLGGSQWRPPGLIWHRTVLEHTGLETRLVDVDDHAIQVTHLTADDASVAVIPAHPYPTGVDLAPGRRSFLIEWANATDAIVIAERLDGRFLRSSIDDSLSAGELALLCESLVEVERSWRDLKQVLDLRPVYHRKEDRIWARAALGFLGLMLVRVVETTVQDSWPNLPRELERM